MNHTRGDDTYSARGAEQEVDLAQQATHPAAVATHYRLSQAYLECLQGHETAADRAS